MKIIKVIFYAIWLFVLSVLCPTFFSSISILGIRPNIFLIFIVITAALKEKGEGAIIGAIFGFAYDLLLGELLGFNALIYMYMGLIVGVLKEKYLSLDSAVLIMLISAVMTFVSGVIYYFAYSMGNEFGFFFALFRLILPEMLYTAVVAFIFFVPVKKSFNIIKERSMMY